MTGDSVPNGIRLRRLRLHSPERTYDVDFRGPDDAPRPLSVIAGAFSTGKTTVLEFVDYCLGASDHPRHPEIMPKVRSATLEVELSGSPYVIQRAVGVPSTVAYVSAGRLDEPGATPPQRRPLRPAGHPDSLSSLLLSHCKLEGVRLRDVPARRDSETDPLSFRDVMWLCYLANERLDNRNLLFEDSPMKQLKLRQVVDVVFDVHDDRAVELGRRVREVEQRLAAARTALEVARAFVDDLRFGPRAELEAELLRAKSTLAETEAGAAALDTVARASTDFAEDLRERHRRATQDADTATALLRDRETQAERMVPLRASYAEDVAQLTMLTEAQRLFDPVRARHPEAGDDKDHDVSGELRAARARLAELTGYLADLEGELPALRTAAARAQEAERRAAAEVDTGTAHAVTPFLAERDALARRREEAAVAMQRAVDGLLLVQALERREADVAALESSAAALREEFEDAVGPGPRADRSSLIGRVGRRFHEILALWRYPKLTDAHVAEDLTPFVRGESYRAASSGGRTLIALAWQLAVFEVAWETRSSHPGFLMLDSPQKNLGQAGDRDTEFADSVTIERIYQHLHDWLAGRGAGAQVVVADNAPPPVADGDVIVRFTRRPDRPPYGLIDDETG
ncbi:hypothetical protein Val02_02510 [Virgisporangium aliadipatigenens]|uniref:Uncharacterized protein n=1 Tax=Virgisporangium aliadipatigenens TaxID=741659 RepID=A0A8J3YG35_9ACTN|nr:DNA recombination protein RecN [Virgisporangium aliadipatigenens]GIJ43365.1 hypothetical protein Val02_02510 [Virgisporangium aliadipatigenens]